MKKLSLPLPFLLALACSSSSQYERGAYTPRPPAPTFNPTTDAPHTTGQPGYVNGQRVERSPNKRYATPSDQPQMMAADGDARRTVELMLKESVPDTTPEGIGRDDFAACWKDIQKMMSRERDLLLTFSPQEVRCLRHRVLAHCGARKNEWKAKHEGLKYSPAFEDFMASDAHKRACGKRGEFRTERTIGPGNRFMQSGDDTLGWRP